MLSLSLSLSIARNVNGLCSFSHMMMGEETFKLFAWGSITNSKQDERSYSISLGLFLQGFPFSFLPVPTVEEIQVEETCDDR